MIRKVWGGNWTWTGEQAQAILTSVLRTGWQQGRDARDFLTATLTGQESLSHPQLKVK